MKILILNGNPNPDVHDFERYLARFTKILEEKGHGVALHTLRDMKIQPCSGCCNCWVKTPGLCSFKDDADKNARAFLAADLVILASPIIMGFISAITKNAMDRIIPLIHPYLIEVNGEVHHMKRYDAYPRLGLLLEKESCTDDEDMTIIHDIFKRAAINMHSSLDFVHYTTIPAEEAADAVDIH